MIHMICPINSATFIVACIDGEIAGILGAGGRTGRSSCTLGRSDGNSGNVGGGGRIGSSGIVNGLRSISKLNVGGIGKSGILGNDIDVGTNLNVGSNICSQILIRDISKYMFGNLNGGMGNIGSCGHKNAKLHE